ncbi:MAG: hypothetical protein LBT84_00260 [Spirochaetia bacterium]|nr:hypothetical protein [Spirochaetia bacterium]
MTKKQSFIPIEGLLGKLYLPEPDENIRKKHPCHDCVFCQWCSEKRCTMCRRDNDS